MDTMGILAFVLLLCLSSSSIGSSQIFNLAANGAVGDGKTDDTKAFLKTWDSFCAATRNPTFLIPSGKSFQVGGVELRGPCKSSNPHIQLAGNIVAPNFLWRPANQLSNWIAINQVDGLTIDGRGSIDGRGRVWWDCKASRNCGTLPNILSVSGCNNFQIGGGLTLTNSPGKHMTFGFCNYVTIDGINIVSPGDSPNTDGVYTQETQHVKIQNSFIGTGDDCVAIGVGSVDVNVTNLACGPGHGISIGSLGAGKSHSIVEQVHVSYVNFSNAQNGVRIKTWQGGSGYARNVLFEQIHFNQVYNPIIIDQYYCNGPRGQCANETSAVQISNVRYSNLHGSASGVMAINLACSLSVGCTGIVMDDINISSGISGKPATSYCLNVHGRIQGSISPAVSCLH